MIGQDVVQIDDLDEWDSRGSRQIRLFRSLIRILRRPSLKQSMLYCGPRGFRLDLPPRPSRRPSRRILAENMR